MSCCGRWPTAAGARIVELLAGEQLCTCHLVELTGARQTNISNHLRVLRQARLVEPQPASRYTYYRLRPEALAALAGHYADLAGRAPAAPPRSGGPAHDCHPPCLSPGSAGPVNCFDCARLSLAAQAVAVCADAPCGSSRPRGPAAAACARRHGMPLPGSSPAPFSDEEGLEQMSAHPGTTQPVPPHAHPAHPPALARRITAGRGAASQRCGASGRREDGGKRSGRP